MSKLKNEKGEKMEEDIKKLIDERELLLSSEYREYTEKILEEIGRELEQQYPGIDFMLKARYKSQKSFEGKVQNILQRDDEEKKKIYDNVGFAIIVKKIPTEAELDHEYCMKLLAQRTDIKNAIANKKSQESALKRKLENTTKEHEEELEQQDSNNVMFERLKKAYMECESAIESDLNHVIEALETLNVSYQDKNNECNRILASHMLKYIMRHSKKLKKLGIQRIPDRTKEHTGGESGYYIASHNAIKSNKQKGWKAEIQALSYQNYQDSKEGDAKHSKRKGKKRILPELPGDTDEEKRSFLQEIKPIVPENLVYQSNKGIYKCSDLENFCYFYIEKLKESPDYFNEILERDILPDKMLSER